MRYRTLGSSDLRVSSIGLGCVTFGREIDRKTSFAILDHAMERGVNLLDTAAAYAEGASERVLGQWMAERAMRDRIVLATKVTGTLSRERVMASAEESLARLKCDRIDLFQLHRWDAQTPIEQTLQALSDLLEQGKVRHVGCSNYTATQLQQVQQALPQMLSVQPPYNLVQREIEADLLPLCRERQVGVISYSPLAAGFLTGKYRQGSTVPEGTRFDVIPGHQAIYFTEEGFAVVESLSEASLASGKSMVELALVWVLSRADINSVLIGARNIEQVKQAFVAEQLLADAEVMRLVEDL